MKVSRISLWSCSSASVPAGRTSPSLLSTAVQWSAQQCNAMPAAPLRQLQNMLHAQSQSAQLMMHQTNPAAADPPSMMSSLEPWPYRPQAAGRPVATPLQHHSISIGVMPATADDNMVPPHCGATGRLPKFFSNLPLQQPPVGVFSVHDLNWCNITDNTSLLAAP
jgi:hypothetical protein